MGINYATFDSRMQNTEALSMHDCCLDECPSGSLVRTISYIAIAAITTAGIAVSIASGAALPAVFVMATTLAIDISILAASCILGGCADRCNDLESIAPVVRDVRGALDNIGITDPAPINEDPVSPEDMVARKDYAHLRLTEIEAMIRSGQPAIDELKRRFEPRANILHFNLDQLLQRYQTQHLPTKLYDFMNWAGIPNNQRRNAFKYAVDTFDSFHLSNQQTAVKNLLKNLAEYFVQEKARVASGSPEEALLKAQFTLVFDKVIDADNNCVDQMLSQMQDLVLDVIAEGTGRQGSAQQRSILLKTGAALCKYRAHLMREIIRSQNPNEPHMADLERVAMSRVAGALGMQGNVFAVGAQFGNLVGDISVQVDEAVNRFLNEYKPFEHLLKDLEGYAGLHRNLRNQIMLWARKYYDFENEAQAAQANGSSAPNLIRRFSADFDGLPADEGGNLTLPALVLILETLELISERG